MPTQWHVQVSSMQEVQRTGSRVSRDTTLCVCVGGGGSVCARVACYAVVLVLCGSTHCNKTSFICLYMPSCG